MYQTTCKNVHVVHIFNVTRMNTELGFSFTNIVGFFISLYQDAVTYTGSSLFQ